MGYQVEGATITHGDPIQANVPRILISGQVTDDQTAAVLGDFTGDNAIDFLRDFALLPLATQDQIVNGVKDLVLRVRSGLPE
jgi:hypothetical protein